MYTFILVQELMPLLSGTSLLTIDDTNIPEIEVVSQGLW